AICHGVERLFIPGFSTRQVEGLQGKCLIQRKVASLSSFVCKVHFGTWSLEISKVFGRDEISNPGTRFWEWPGY
ncbi:unnamed protein product, partial [Staurois parvus]